MMERRVDSQTTMARTGIPRPIERSMMTLRTLSSYRTQTVEPVAMRYRRRLMTREALHTPIEAPM